MTTQKATNSKIAVHRRKSRLSLSKIVLILAFCCFLTLLLSFIHGSILHTQHAASVVNPGLPLAPREEVGKPVTSLRVAGLSCQPYGGPSDEAAQEMVYWQDIPSDSQYVSPYRPSTSLETQLYLTFEPDGGGWNNIRMAMETVLTLAHAMGRTLVLPPEQEMYLLRDKSQAQRKDFSFNDFFPMEAIAAEERGLDIITMEEFLRREGVTGHLKDRNGQVSFPPDQNRTLWNGMSSRVATELEPWLQSVSIMPEWKPDLCMAAFPADPRQDPDGMALQQVYHEIMQKGGFPEAEHFVGYPVPVDGSVKDRMAENNKKERGKLCIYNSTLQKEPLLHFPGKRELAGGRLLVHFYAFLFFEDWRQDLWTKRFVRDHIRYVDEIQCAAARVVQAVRERARSRAAANNPRGEYDAFHIRRGEFQYKRTRVESIEIYNISKDEIKDGTTVYIASDERNKDYFKDMAAHYDLVYLDDYLHLLKGVNTNFYGMIDQLVASRSRVFFGCWFSTFTGYINRIRGYHADRLKLPGFEQGLIQSYYYVLPQNKMRMREYWPISGAFYAREFPVSWRNIDYGIQDSVVVSSQ